MLSPVFLRKLLPFVLVAVLADTLLRKDLLGTRLALRHGAAFVRIVFILVVSALALRTGYDAFLR